MGPATSRATRRTLAREPDHAQPGEDRQQGRDQRVRQLLEHLAGRPGGPLQEHAPDDVPDSQARADQPTRPRIEESLSPEEEHVGVDRRVAVHQHVGQAERGSPSGQALDQPRRQVAPRAPGLGEEGETDRTQHEHGRRAAPGREDARGGEAVAGSRIAVWVQHLERDQQQEAGDQHVHPVGFHRAGVEDEIGGAGDHGGREQRGTAGKPRANRQRIDHEQDAEAGEERKQLQRPVVHAEDGDREALDPEERHRSGLVVVERREQVEKRPGADVEGHSGFVDPERSAADDRGPLAAPLPRPGRRPGAKAMRVLPCPASPFVSVLRFRYGHDRKRNRTRAIERGQYSRAQCVAASSPVCLTDVSSMRALSLYVRPTISFRRTSNNLARA